MRWTAEGDSLVSMREEEEQQPDRERARRSADHASHWRVGSQTGANLTMLLVALVLTLAPPFSSTTTTVVEEAAPPWTLLALLVLAVGLDLVWKRVRAGRTMGIPAPRPTGGA